MGHRLVVNVQVIREEFVQVHFHYFLRGSWLHRDVVVLLLPMEVCAREENSRLV
jgi:hypothetical protein